MEDIGHISMHLTVSSSSAVFHFDVISLRNYICLHLVVSCGFYQPFLPSGQINSTRNFIDAPYIILRTPCARYE